MNDATVDAARGRVAIYVAGDTAIYFPALVALTSIQTHNPDRPFDYYLSFEHDSLTDEMAATLRAYNIKFVPSEDLASFGITEDLPVMSEGQWPRAVMRNWVMPMYLHDVGHRYALKVDYDILCVDSYRLEDLMEPIHLFAGAVFQVDLAAQGIDQEVCDAIGIESVKDVRSVSYWNVGVTVINLERYATERILMRFKEHYEAVSAASRVPPNAEQAALALVAMSRPDGIRKIDPSYNVRTSTLPELDGNFRAQIRNIHYITHNKPWKRPNFKYLESYVPGKRTCYYMYRDAWLRYAERLPGFNSFVEAEPASVHTTIGGSSQLRV